MGFPGSSVVKDLSANAGNTGDACLISGLGRTPGRGNGNPVSVLSQENSWTEETGGLYNPWDCRVGHNRVTEYTHKVQY